MIDHSLVSAVSPVLNQQSLAPRLIGYARVSTDEDFDLYEGARWKEHA